MDSTKFLLYTLGRIALIVAVSAFAVLVSDIIWPALGTLLPEGSFRDAFLGENLRSVVAFVVILAFLLPLFYDDGKKHAAYEIWSSVNVTLTLIFMFMVCFVPSIFRDSFEQSGEASVFYNFAYFPYLWLRNKAGLDFIVSVLVGLLMILGLLFGIYVFSFKRYAKLHPVILGGPRRGEIQAVKEEAENEA
ncbi:MAG: hypothetical protein IKN17_07000 [Ruminococcus sp.]|nr:hypothetical protein [Ruminococcus sp.]